MAEHLKGSTDTMFIPVNVAGKQTPEEVEFCRDGAELTDSNGWMVALMEHQLIGKNMQGARVKAWHSGSQLFRGFSFL